VEPKLQQGQTSAERKQPLRSPAPSSAKRTGAQLIWEALVREGVDTVFGYPGGAIMPAYDALPGYNRDDGFIANRLHHRSGFLSFNWQ
jgi:hypothetical protein